MIYLLSFSPFQPSPGLALWSLIIFLLFWFLMAKFAFRPIANALSKREKDIQDALEEAKKAREEMANLKAENDKILAEAREERAAMLKEAKDTKASIINDAKNEAKAEAQKIATKAKAEIESEKKAAIADLKNQVGSMAIGIAEEILKKDLNGGQDDLVSKLVNDIKLN